MRPVRHKIGSPDKKALKKDNIAFGVANENYGPTSETGYYSGHPAPISGYIVVSLNNSNLPEYRVAPSESDLIPIANNLGGNVSTINDAKSYIASRSNTTFITPISSDLVTDGLVVNLEANNLSSYPETGNKWYDLSPNSNNVTLRNNPTYNSDGYISFDGTNDYATFDSEYSFSTGNNDYTFEVWFKMRTLPTAQYGANGHIWGGENGNDVVMYLNPQSGGVSRGIMVHDDSRYNTGHMTSGGFEANTWHQWVAVADSANDKISHYIDGKLDRENGPMLSSQQDRTWGGTRFAYDARWGTYSNLDLAVARQYNRQLTADEVAQNFYKGKCITNNLKLYLDADNIISTQDKSKWYDISGNGYHATKYGSPNLTTLGGAKCWELDSVGDYFDINNTFNGLSSLTLEAWIYPAASELSTGDRGAIIQGTVYMSWNKGNRRLSSYWYSTNNQGYHEPSKELAREQWHHLCTVWTGTQLLQYIDGKLENTVNTTIQQSGGTMSGRIGRESDSRQFAGGLGMIKVYTNALTADEVATNFNSYKSRFRK